MKKKERKSVYVWDYCSSQWWQESKSFSEIITLVLNSLFFRDVISETESDNQQRQIHQEAHRVFRSRRHISEDLENEHLEPRDLDNVRKKNIQIQKPQKIHIPTHICI